MASEDDNDELVGFKALVCIFTPPAEFDETWPEQTDVVWIDVTPDLWPHMVGGGKSELWPVSGSWLSSLEEVEEKH